MSNDTTIYSQTASFCISIIGPSSLSTVNILVSISLSFTAPLFGLVTLLVHEKALTSLSEVGGQGCPRIHIRKSNQVVRRSSPRCNPRYMYRSSQVVLCHRILLPAAKTVDWGLRIFSPLKSSPALVLCAFHLWSISSSPAVMSSMGDGDRFRIELEVSSLWPAHRRLLKSVTWSGRLPPQLPE